MSDLLAWAEQAGIENLKQQKSAADLLRKEGTTTLTVLLAGATGMLAYGVKGLESGLDWLSVGSLSMSGLLYFLAVMTVQKVLRFQGFPAIYNEPLNLYQKGFALDVMREVELENLQERINQGSARNEAIFKMLNRIRTCAACSPILFVATSLGYYFFG